MQDFEKDSRTVNSPNKTRFDESKLTETQRRAFDIAKAQGVKPIHSLDELRLDIAREMIDDLISTVLENRRKNRRHLKTTN